MVFNCVLELSVRKVRYTMGKKNMQTIGSNPKHILAMSVGCKLLQMSQPVTPPYYGNVIGRAKFRGVGRLKDANNKAMCEP